MIRGRGHVQWVLTIALVAGAFLASTARAPAAWADMPSAAGTGVGSVVVFTPTVSITPTVVMPPPPVLPTTRGVISSPFAAPLPGAGPAIPGVLILTPVPATGALAVPTQVSLAPGAMPSFSTWQLVIPGPNPAQNTPVALSQLLDTLLAPARPSGGVVIPATVLTAP